MSFVGGVGYSNIDLIYSGLDRLPDKGGGDFRQRIFHAVWWWDSGYHDQSFKAWS